MERAEKKALVESLHEDLKSAKTVVVSHYKGLTVAQITALRDEVRKSGAKMKVAKNRLVKIALKDTPFAHLESHFIGPTAITYSTDEVAAAKAVAAFSQKNEFLQILGGGMGETQLSKADVEALAKMPSLDELRAKLVGLLQTPASRLASVLQAPAGQLARVCGAYGAKG